MVSRWYLAVYPWHVIWYHKILFDCVFPVLESHMSTMLRWNWDFYEKTVSFKDKKITTHQKWTSSSFLFYIQILHNHPQVPQCIKHISHNSAFCNRMCVHISVTIWCIVGYESGKLQPCTDKNYVYHRINDFWILESWCIVGFVQYIWYSPGSPYLHDLPSSEKKIMEMLHQIK